MLNPKFLFGILSLALLTGFSGEKQVFAQSPQADETKTTTQNPSEHFMRIRKDSRGRDVALETSVTRYELKDDEGNRITVDLIGAVHIGEKEYFEKLNQRFEYLLMMLNILLSLNLEH